MSQLSSYHDNELASLLTQGSTAAFEELYNRHWQNLYNAAYKRLKDIDQSKDIVQDVFTDLWSRKEKIAIDNISAYLHTAVRFQIYKLAGKGAASDTFYQLFAQMAHSPFSADAGILQKEMADLINAWLNALPEKRRQITMLHLSQQLSTAEIAEQLNISRKTVQNQWGTALDQLKVRLAHFLLLLSTLGIIALL